MSAAKSRKMPSTWFVQHAYAFGRGVRVLDLACGSGRHAVPAAVRGAHVVAVDRDAAKLEAGEKAARAAGVEVTWQQADLTVDALPAGPFDVVMVFNYLDRSRFRAFLDAVAPGGLFMAETYLEAQRQLDWGPTSEAHLLETGELTTLVEPYEVVLAREVVEVLDGHARALASVLAQRPRE